MGSRIACHFANIGCQVVLLDIVPFDLKDEEKEKKSARNRIVDAALKATLKSNPSAIYDKAFASRIRTGNFTDNMDWIADCDWVLEAVIERLDIKKQVFENVEKHRKPGTLISSNTSGIPIQLMLEGRSDDFKNHFCGTHFFNPPRYLKLFEVIPSTETDSEVIDFLMEYGDRFLGKKTVLCKDTPAFIANRIGVFSIMAIFKLAQDLDMTVEEIDALTGPIAGRPKSATFRTSDVVGLDTLVKVAKGVYDTCPNDEARSLFEIPEFLTTMESNGWLGSKTGQGFYKKSKSAEGKRELHVLNLKTMEYAPKAKAKFECIATAKPVDDLKKRVKILHEGKDKGAQFLKQLSYHLFQYVSNRIPEISDEVYRVDDALRAGFGWELGPFEHWDAIGFEQVLAEMDEAGFKCAQWIYDMKDAGVTSFYKVEDGQRKVFDPASKSYQVIPGTESYIVLDNLRGKAPVWSNSGATLHDIGDGVLNLEFHTKMNAIGSEVLEGINTAIQIAEDQGWNGLVLGNDAPNFSAGANLGMIFMLAAEQEFDELDFAVRTFQNTVMRVRYSGIPVVAAPHGLTLGGGCEITMHSDAAIVSAETYIGLVEFGVGLLPAGGGTKEMALRASDEFNLGDPQIPSLQSRFVNVATAKVATSGHEGFGIGVLDVNKDEIIVSQARQIMEAKHKVLELQHAGYTPKTPRTDVEVLGRTALATLYAGTTGFRLGNYASEHDQKIANKIAWTMCGGDLSTATKVSEQYLLDLEREAFLSLLGEQKTLERIQHMLTTGKPLRN
ncbi:UNVERIFIED_CONTAM: hypothetical protein GTU68_030515 [Idotea baltica]|nr:hypothetical protein [Idotea baltica]